MKRDEFRESVSDQPINQVEDAVANDNLHETGLREFEASADYYERCWRSRIEFHQSPWWTTVGLYLILISVVFMAL